MNYMTQQHIARLRADCQRFVDANPQATFEDLKKHTISLGWNLMDSKMFADWLNQQGIKTSGKGLEGDR